MMPNQCAAANRRPAGQSDGSGNLFAAVAADRAFPAAVGEFCRCKMKRYAGIATAIAALALAGCAEQNDSLGDSRMKKQNEDIQTIKQLAETWRSGWLAGDADLLLSLYADEPVLMPQDRPVVAGKGSIRPLYEAVLSEFDFQSEGTVKEVVVSGDMGYFWSAYTLTATPKAGGEPMKVTGKSLFIVRREPGGAWKIARLMDNSDGVTTGQDQHQKGEPDGAANGSQPFSSETNTTSSAAGSRR